MMFRLAVIVVSLLWSVAANAMTREGQSCLSADSFRDQQKAIELCAIAIEKGGVSEKELSELYHQRGEAFYWTVRGDLAIRDFDQALKLNPDAVEAQIQRGWAKLRISDPGAAYQDFVDALTKKPESGRAVYAIGYMYRYHSPQPEKAISAYTQALELSPNYHLARSGIIEYYRHVDWNPERVLKELDSVLALDEKVLHQVRYFETDPYAPREFGSWMRQERAEVLQTIGRNDEALKEYSTLIAKHPDAAPFLERRAYLYRAMRNPVAALKDVEAASKIRRYCDCLLEVRLSALFALKRLDEVERLASEAIETADRAEEIADSHFWRGAVRKRKGDLVGAKADFESAIAGKPMWTASILTQLVQRGYYKGDVREQYNEKASNGLEACLIDPECL